MQQYHVYSVSTNDFNTVAEQELFSEMVHYRKWKRVLSAIPAKDERHAALSARLNIRIATARQNYLDLIQQNNLVRELREDALNEYHLVSLFESSLSRMCGFVPGEVTKDLIIVETFFYDITKQNVLNGIIVSGEKYRYLYSSAAEIRTKKTVFIKESLYEKIEKTLMCGLMVSKINKLGGINPNKMIAYTALSSSATDVWDIDLDRCIVIDDIETEVEGEVDFIDDVSYTIKRETRMNLIAQNDGAGMILPKISRKAFMVRLPWIKGALCPFNFVKYITENSMSPKIKDIYGIEHDVIEENIHVIFTKSQFKLWKFYKDFDEYKAKFKKHHCIAGYCNLEPDKIPTSAINYQMLQTLIDITDEELDQLVAPSNNTLKTIGTSKETMLRVFGADSPDTPYQEALLIYPELLTDAYSKEKLKEIKKSLVKRFKAGKLEIYGKYTFVFPDWTFLMDRWFGHIKKPKGLLADGEVYCKLFPAGDLLLERAPHLYIEHCPRYNNVNDDTSRWFGVSSSVFVSPHDLVSRIVMLDWDGDKLLVTDNKTLIEVAKRTIKKYDVVPLYYVAKKAEATKITPESLYSGLEAGFKHSNIGIYSNNITKIWNSVDWPNAPPEEASRYLNIVKLLCAENNFVID